jgi:2-octaprenyl-6-methoxyphenol hydroxylase
VGAGPAGLACALLLAARGVPTALIGPPASDKDSRTTALLHNSVAMLEEAGVWHLARPCAAPLRVMRIVDATSRLIRARPLSFEAAEIGLEAFGWNIMNGDLVRVMEEAAAATPLIERHAGTVDRFVSGDNDITLGLSDGHERRVRLVVAADGRASACRTAAHIPVREWRYGQVAMALNLGHERPHHDISTEFHTEAGPFTLVPLPGARSSLVWAMRPAEADRHAALTDGELAEEIERRCQSLLGRMTIEGRRSLWPMAGLTATRFADRRVALIGEAAHVFPPIGAQGFNLTMRDCAALADLLPGASDPGAPAILRAYAERRRADVAGRTMSVDLLNRSLLSDLLPVQLGRSLGLYAMERSAPLRRLVMRQGLSPGLGA